MPMLLIFIFLQSLWAEYLVELPLVNELLLKEGQKIEFMSLSRGMRLRQFIIPKGESTRCAKVTLKTSQGMCQVCTDQTLKNNLVVNRDIEITGLTFNRNFNKCGENPSGEYSQKDLLDRDSVIKRLQTIFESTDLEIYSLFHLDSYGNKISSEIVNERFRNFFRFKRCMEKAGKSSTLTCMNKLKNCFGVGCSEKFKFNDDDIFNGQLGAETFGFMSRELLSLSCKDYRYTKYRIELKKYKGREVHLRCVSDTGLLEVQSL